MTDVHTPPAAERRSSVRRRGRRATALTLLLLMMTPLLAGCLRVQVSMGVTSDDRVSGQVVAATIPADDDDAGPQLAAPPSLGAKVRVQPYDQDGYRGTQAFFDNLTFGEVQELGAMSADVGGALQIALNRSGDVVTLTGSVDLEKVPAQGSDVQFTIAFPSRVASTNGNRDSDSIVTWKLPSGETTDLRAEVRYADPNTRGFAGWVGIVIGVALGVSVVVGGVAYLTRNPAPARSRR